MKLRDWMVKHKFIKDFTKWQRLDLEDPGQPSLSETDRGARQRAEAEKETNKDLRKPIQQLICDVHEEVTAKVTDSEGRPLEEDRPLQENLIHVIKRQNSMMGRVALEHEWNSVWLFRFTGILVILTIVLVVLTAALLIRSCG